MTYTQVLSQRKETEKFRWNLIVLLTNDLLKSGEHLSNDDASLLASLVRHPAVQCQLEKRLSRKP